MYTYLGGSNDDYATSMPRYISTDILHFAPIVMPKIAGYTYSSDFRMINEVFQYGGGIDGWVAVISKTGT